MIIGIDIDGVCRDFISSVIKIIKRDFPEALLKEDVDTWDFNTTIDWPVNKIVDIWRTQYPQEIYEFADPFNNSKQQFDILIKHIKTLGYKSVIISDQQKKHQSYSIAWLDKHGFKADDIIFSSYKHKHVDILIDDSLNMLKKWISGGSLLENFILFDRPYNQDFNPIYRISNLLEVISILQLK